MLSVADFSSPQAAVDAAADAGGGQVFFPRGDYVTDLLLPSGVELFGVQSHWTEGNSRIFGSVAGVPGCENVTLRSLSVHAQSGNRAMMWEGSKGIRIADCEIRWGEVRFESSIECWITDCFLQNSSEAALYMTEASDFDISGNDIATYGDGMGGPGIHLVTSSGYNRIRGNYVFLCQTGIQVQSGPGNIITGNVVRTNQREGIYLSGQGNGVVDNVVSSNVVFDNGRAESGSQAGILLDQEAHHNVIVANRCFNKGGQQLNGIRLAGSCYENIVTQNVVAGNVRPGIQDTSSGDGNLVAMNVGA